MMLGVTVIPYTQLVFFKNLDHYMYLELSQLNGRSLRRKTHFHS